MGLLNFILNLSENKDDKNADLEREMDWNKFSDEEKDLVRNGDYDIYNLEDSDDDNLDEDDYYYDK